MKFSGYQKDVIISQNVIKAFKSYEQTNNKNEAGGILLGKVYEEYIFIEDLTTPSIFDKYGKYFFIRSKNAAQKIINKNWNKSDGQTIYLGEWHTHSELNPKPSVQDCKMIKNCLQTTEMEIDFLILVIIGLSDSVWLGIQTNTSLKKLALINLNI